MTTIRTIEINKDNEGPFKCTIRPYIPRVHMKSVMDIMNYYIENTLKDYCDEKFDKKMFLQLVNCIGTNPFYVVEIESNGHDKVIGFGYLFPHGRFKSFRYSADLGISIMSDYTRKGIGKALLDILIFEGKKAGLKTILSSVSSYNIASINFHEKNGFVRCGLFKDTCNKLGKDISEVWMQLVLKQDD